MADYDNPRPSTQPVGTTEQVVLKDNLITTDQFVNTDELTVTNRKGRVSDSLAGIELKVNDAIRDAGGVPLNGGVWAAGQTFTAYNQYMIYNGVAYKPLATTVLPYGPTGAVPDANFVGPYDSGANVVNVSQTVVLTAGQTTIPSGQDLTQSSIYISGSTVDRGRLKLNIDYTLTNSFELELISSFPAGTELEIITRDLEEAITIPEPSTYSFTESQLITSSVAKVGDTVFIPEKGNAKYVINESSYALLTGDLTLSSGLKAALQPGDDGAWNVLWFDALPDTNNQYLTFDLAAQRGLQAVSVSAGSLNTRGPVRVPVGNWTLGQQVPTEALWLLEPGAEFTQPTNYLPSNTDNLEYLNGDVFKLGARGFNVLQIGDVNLDWIANNWRASSQGTAVVQAASRYGAPCFSAFTRSSDNPSGGEGTIGYQAYVANDNETDIGNSYCYFAATYKAPNAGTTFTTETNVTTIGTTVPVFPYGDYGGTAGITVNHWVGGPEGGTVGGFEDVDKRATSAGMVFSPGLAINPGNGNKWGFDAGIVFLKVAFENGSQDVIRSFTGSRFQYWRDGGGDSVVRLIGNEDESSAGSGKYEIQVRDVSDASLINYRFYRDKFITTDNKANLGQPTNRWITPYSYNALDTVSDANEKYDETPLSENEINCFIAVGKLTKKWKWKKERDSKGAGETVYWHAGPIAQELESTMESFGLNVSEWGLINVQADGKYSIIRDEINSLVNAAIIAKVGL